MKSSRIAIGFAFLLGVLVASGIFGLWNHQKYKALDKIHERDIDRTLGHFELQSVSIYAKALQLIQSNKLQKAQNLLVNETWVSLESAWKVDQQYKGAVNDLDEELQPMLRDFYPQLRQQVNLSQFSNWPNSMLLEMTNFMKAVESSQAVSH